MYSRLSRIICLCLALLVFTGSVGMAATRHICLVSGLLMPEKTQSTGDGCCKKKDAEQAPEKNILKAKCCELSVSHYKVEAETGNGFPSVKLPVLFIQPLVRFVPDWLSSVNRQLIFITGFNKAPPRAGRTLLSFIQILRI